MVTKSLDKTKAVNIIYNFFNQFSGWFGKAPKTPSAGEMEKFLSKDLQMFNNGQLVVKGAANYLDRLQKFQKKYSDFQISKPLEEPLVCDNKGALYYQLDLTTHQGQKSQILILGLFTLEDEKISRWVEVTCEKNARTWDT